MYSLNSIQARKSTPLLVKSQSCNEWSSWNRIKFWRVMVKQHSMFLDNLRRRSATRMFRPKKFCMSWMDKNIHCSSRERANGWNCWLSMWTLHVPWRVRYPLLSKVKTELDRMVAQGIISKVERPTDWCSGLVVVPKANKTDVRLCVDLTQLNKAVKREFHPMSSVDDSLAKLSNARYFTRLDANSGFWQIPLDSESQLLTTFITPYGRFCFHSLCFGITSAPDIFQRTMNKILEGVPGVICHMDEY